jgi:hypothetical protein
VLPPGEAVELLRDRASRLKTDMAALKVQLAFLSTQSFTDLIGPDDPVPAPLLGQKFPAIFLVETEYRLAMLKAEQEFVDTLARRVTEEGWGPVEVWRDIQAGAERRYQDASEGRQVTSTVPEPVAGT